MVRTSLNINQKKVIVSMAGKRFASQNKKDDPEEKRQVAEKRYHDKKESIRKYM